MGVKKDAWVGDCLLLVVEESLGLQVRVRDDKGPEQATSADQVAEMYRAQAVLAAKGRGQEPDED